ncbi:2-amino-4-hydroxy-6-hydroxymethyldihydropteridine diphosphokinase [Paracoccus sp. (in: a-proteobacteria)]|uniref:2-amino-4-hydroxy-6- hydroxymethyldihydropteridine diphosphokinase n=1 Tax=Paracoccus sp. TaxID=267 RepID=UPI00321FAD97
MTENECANANLALVALGANLPSSAGIPLDSLRLALRRMQEIPGLRLAAVSRFWHTPAHPPGSGPEFLNAAVRLQCRLPAAEVLAQLHRIEAELGRSRDGARWQARVLDLDLLALGDQVWPDAATQDRWRALPPEAQARQAPPGLILPHPRLQDRGFVLAPLAEVAPLWRHPRLGLSVAEMLRALPPAALAGMRPASA